MITNVSQIRVLSSRLPGRSSRVPLVALLAAIGFAVAFFGAAPVQSEASATLPLYTNKLDTAAKRSKVVQVGKGSCNKGKGTKSFRFSLGKKTSECSYRVPVVGSSIEISGTGVLYRSTPSKIINRTFLALSTRQASDGSRYQLAVFPAKKRFELRKVAANGRIEVLARNGNVKQIKPPDGSNRLTLRAFNRVTGLPADTVRLVARVNGTRVALFDDAQGSQLTGRESTFSVGSSASARGAKGSFRAIEVRIPDPLG